MSIKVAYCIPALYSVSGMEKTLTIKANYLADVLDYEVYIITTDGKDREPAFRLSDKIRVINLDINYDAIWGDPLIKKSLKYFLKQILFRRRLTKVLNEIKPDITVSMLRREINFITKIKDGSKKVGEMHFNKANYRDLDKKGSSNIFISLITKLWMGQLVRNLRRLDKFVVLTYEDKEKWHELNDVSVIYNPLENYPQKASDCSSKKVIAAGRFVRQKGFDMLIDSWAIVAARHPDWTLTIYGNGNKESFRKQVNDNDLANSCILMDAIDNLYDKFSDSSIFALSSRFEGFGMVISEAMACGIPPVAFKCPCGPKDIIEDRVNGLLVEAEDIQGLAEKICYLIENEEARKEMGKMARIRAERFRIENIAKEWDDLFRSLI